MTDRAAQHGQRHPDAEPREPYEAPELQMIATVDEATLGTLELVSDAMGFGGSIT